MNVKTFLSLAAAMLLCLALAACGSDAVLSDVAVSAPALDLRSPQPAVTIQYRIHQTARVTVALEGAGGARHVLREDVQREPSGDPYQLSFNGSASLDSDTRRILPDGDYTVVVAAAPLDGGQAREERAALSIRNAPTEQFDVYDLAVVPNPFSPDEDAIDDETKFTYRLPITASVTLEIVEPERGTRYPVVTRAERGPGEQSERWTGRPVVGGLLPAGIYQYVLVADDNRGNRVTKRGDVELSSAGIGQMSLLEVQIGPPRQTTDPPATIELGDVITVTYRVKNTGAIPLRTFGPPSGYLYNTNQTFSSIEEEKYANLGGGLWRVGLDWEGNGGSGSRYPFRWAISPRPPEQWYDPGNFDYLQPGEEATIIGRVEIKQRESRMTFFVGVAHEGVDYPLDRLKQTLIRVLF
ncbi:MAG TPA: hypothetical protein VD886_14310 [Herpetosiphonaceae bacterium]|nr:hypothetical protein [Herpetosiphonaceae bacterium]